MDSQSCLPAEWQIWSSRSLLPGVCGERAGAGHGGGGRAGLGRWLGGGSWAIDYLQVLDAGTPSTYRLFEALAEVTIQVGGCSGIVSGA